MDIKIFPIYLLALAVLSSCSHKKLIEEDILSDIFPQLVDSIGIRMTNLIPAPPPGIYDADSNFVGVDTIAGNMILSEREKVIARIDSVDSRLLIGLVDSIFSFNLTDIIARTDFDPSLILNHFHGLETSNSEPRKLDFNSINLGPNYEIKSQSDLEKQYPDFWNIINRKFAGVVAISKIYFSKDMKFGLLRFETFPFQGEGAGYYVLIEQTNSGWRVKRIVTNWIT